MTVTEDSVRQRLLERVDAEMDIGSRKFDALVDAYVKLAGCAADHWRDIALRLEDELATARDLMSSCASDLPAKRTKK